MASVCSSFFTDNLSSERRDGAESTGVVVILMALSIPSIFIFAILAFLWVQRNKTAKVSLLRHQTSQRTVTTEVEDGTSTMSQQQINKQSEATLEVDGERLDTLDAAALKHYENWKALIEKTGEPEPDCDQSDLDVLKQLEDEKDMTCNPLYGKPLPLELFIRSSSHSMIDYHQSEFGGSDLSAVTATTTDQDIAEYELVEYKAAADYVFDHNLYWLPQN